MNQGRQRYEYSCIFCGLVDFVLLAVMLLAGVPIAIALAVSPSVPFFRCLNLGASVLTGAQRIFSGILCFQSAGHSLFILAGNIMKQGRHCHPPNQLCQAVSPAAFLAPWPTPMPWPTNMLWSHFRLRYSGCFCHGIHHRRPHRGGGRDMIGTFLRQPTLPSSHRPSDSPAM